MYLNLWSEHTALSYFQVVFQQTQFPLLFRFQEMLSESEADSNPEEVLPPLFPEAHFLWTVLETFGLVQHQLISQA